jgi:hypothetical protein
MRFVYLKMNAAKKSLYEFVRFFGLDIDLDIKLDIKNVMIFIEKDVAVIDFKSYILGE